MGPQRPPITAKPYEHFKYHIEKAGDLAEGRYTGVPSAMKAQTHAMMAVAWATIWQVTEGRK